MKSKHTLLAYLVILIALAFSNVAFGETVIGVETKEQPPPSESKEPSRGILPIPTGATVIDFDDVSAPCNFSETTALRYKSGVIFLGTGGKKNGGAILDECSNFDVTGYSSPNFLAFNPDASMSDGGIPKTPELLIFLKPVSSVQINAGVGFDFTGPVIMIAIDSNHNVVGYDVIQVASQMQTLSVQGPDIKVVIIIAKTQGMPPGAIALDDLVFTP